MKISFYILTLLFSASFGFGQKSVIKISVDFEDVEVGDPVTITVRSLVPGNLEITFPDEFVSGSGIQSGIQQEMDYNTGKVKKMYFYSQNGAFTKDGNYSFRALITDKNQVYKSKPVTVKVHKQAPANEEISRKNLRQPIFGVIERSKARVYEGEPLIVNGKIYSKLKVAVQGYHPFELIGNPELIQLNSSNDLIFSPEMIKGQKYASAQFGKQLLFFTSPGKYQINPFEMAVLYEIEENYPETLAFTSNGNSVEVVPLPSGAPNDFIGGVGKYTCSRSCDKTSAKQGDVITMTLIISGYGNLHNINTPVIKLPKGVVIYGDPEIDEQVNFGLRGAEGKMIYKYNLQIIQAGDFHLPELTISYFDPEKKKYITLREHGIAISGEKSDSFQAQLPQEVTKKNDEKSGLSPIMASGAKIKNDHFINSFLFWPSVVSPVAFAFLGGLFFTRKKKTSEKVNEKSKKKERIQEVSHLLKTAELKAGSGLIQEGFALVQQALRLMASIVLDSEKTNLTKLEITEGLQELEIDAEITAQFNRLLLHCEEARYAFVDQPDLFHTTLDETRKMTQKLL